MCVCVALVYACIVWPLFGLPRDRSSALPCPVKVDRADDLLFRWCMRANCCVFWGDILGLCRRDVFIRLILLPAMTKVGCFFFARASRSQRLVSLVVVTRVCKHHFLRPGHCPRGAATFSFVPFLRSRLSILGTCNV